MTEFTEITKTDEIGLQVGYLKCYMTSCFEDGGYNVRQPLAVA